MHYYETLYIIHPALEAGRLKDIIMSVEDSLKKMGGKPLAVELWGKRKLSHYIDKQKYGTYVLLQYNGEGKCTGNFAVELEHNPNILAYLTTIIDQNNVLEQQEDLDMQIAGKTREAERTESSSKDGRDKNAVKSKQEDPQNLETNDEKENPEEVQNKLLSDESGNEQTDIIKKEAKDVESEPEDNKLADVEEQLEEESKQNNADETSIVSKEE